MKKLEFYRDESGVPAARGSDQRLATYLETDIQGSPEIAEQIVQSLKNPDFRGDITGNGHCVTVSQQLALIESLYDEEAPARRLTRSDLLSAIQRWQKFIQ